MSFNVGEDNNFDTILLELIVYDGRWWPGVVEGIAGGESPEYQIKFMKSSSSCTQNRFYWPTDDEIDSLPSNEILTVISGPPIPITNIVSVMRSTKRFRKSLRV